MTTRKQLGNTGEHIARTYCERLGWEVIATNWRCELGEIDLIARDGETLVFVEVRTRRGKHALQMALNSVDEFKQARLADVVNAYLTLNELECTVRVDVLGIALMPDGLFSVEMVHDALKW
jgi:putative endonuclease